MSPGACNRLDTNPHNTLDSHPVWSMYRSPAFLWAQKAIIFHFIVSVQSKLTIVFPRWDTWKWQHPPSHSLVFLELNRKHLGNTSSHICTIRILAIIARPSTRLRLTWPIATSWNFIGKLCSNNILGRHSIERHETSRDEASKHLQFGREMNGSSDGIRRMERMYNNTYI